MRLTTRATNFRIASVGQCPSVECALMPLAFNLQYFPSFWPEITSTCVNRRVSLQSPSDSRWKTCTHTKFGWHISMQWPFVRHNVRKQWREMIQFSGRIHSIWVHAEFALDDARPHNEKCVSAFFFFSDFGLQILIINWAWTGICASCIGAHVLPNMWAMPAIPSVSTLPLHATTANIPFSLSQTIWFSRNLWTIIIIWKCGFLALRLNECHGNQSRRETKINRFSCRSWQNAQIRTDSLQLNESMEPNSSKAPPPPHLNEERTDSAAKSNHLIYSQ